MIWKRALKKFESQKENQLNHAKQQANQIVNDAQRKADQIIADLRKMRTQSASAVKENELVDAKTKLNKLEQPINLKRIRFYGGPRTKRNSTLMMMFWLNHTVSEVSCFGKLMTTIGKFSLEF